MVKSIQDYIKPYERNAFREYIEEIGRDTVEMELSKILALEIERELCAERLGISSELVTDEMAKDEPQHRMREIVRQIKLSANNV